MFGQPVRGGGPGSDRAANQDARAAADQSADEHAACRAATSLERVAAVVAKSFELAFLIHVGTVNVGVGQACVEELTLAGGKNHSLGKNSDRGPARDATRLAHLSDAAFDGRSHGNQSTAVDDNRLSDLCLKRIANPVAEGCQSRIEPDHQGGPCRYG